MAPSWIECFDPLPRMDDPYLITGGNTAAQVGSVRVRGAPVRGKRVLQLIAIAGVAGLAACSNTTTNSTTGNASIPAGPPSITSEPFGQVDGTPVIPYTLTSGHGMRARIPT